MQKFAPAIRRVDRARGEGDAHVIGEVEVSVDKLLVKQIANCGEAADRALGLALEIHHGFEADVRAVLVVL